MLNVIYEYRANNTREVKKDIVETQREYLQERIEKYKTILRLTEEDTTFIVNLLLLIARYMAYVVPIEEHNTLTAARLIGHCPLSSYCDEGYFFSMVEQIIENEDGGLAEDEILRLRQLWDQAVRLYNDERVLLTIQVLQLDCALNCDINSAAASLINLAAIKHSGKRISDAGQAAINSLENELLDFDCASSCYLQFDNRYKKLRSTTHNKHYNVLTQYAYGRFEELPIRIKNKINEYDFQIYVANELFGGRMNQQSNGEFASGMFFHHERQLHVWMLATTEYINSSLNHEIGHVVDYIIGQENSCFRETVTDDNVEWEEIFVKERDSYYREKVKIAPDTKTTHEHEISVSSEYFAGSFAAYIDNPEWLKESCPLTYNYIDNLLNTCL